MKKIYFLSIFISILFAYEGIFDNKYKFILGYQYTQHNFLLQSIDKEEILVDINGKLYKYFDKIYREYRLKLLSNNVSLSFESKLFGKIWYGIDFQIVPSQNVEFNSVQKLCSTEYGWCSGVTVSYSLFPQTIVSDGINIASKIFFENYKFNFLISNTEKYKIDTLLNITSVSIGVNFSKLIKKVLEINYGAEFLYYNSSLIDKINYFIVSGKESIIQIFLSGRIYITKNESIKLEIIKSIDNNKYIILSGIIIRW